MRGVLRGGPGLGGIAGLGVVAHPIEVTEGAFGAHRIGGGLHQGIQHGVAAEAEDEAHIMGVAPGHRCGPSIVAVAADGDGCVRPVGADPAHQTAQMVAHFDAAGRLARTQDHAKALPAGGVVEVDRQKAAFVVVGVEQRELLMPVHAVERVVDVERDRLGRTMMAAAPQIDHGAAEPQQGAQIGRVLQPRDGRLGSQISPAFGKSAAGELEGGVVAQVVEVVTIRIAAGNGEDARTQDGGHIVRDMRRAAVVWDQSRQRIHQAQPPVGAGQQHHAAIGTQPAAIEGGGDLLAANGWQAERQKRIIEHGGCGSLRLAKRLVQTPKSLNQLRGLHHARQRIPAMRVNKTG